MKYTIDELDVMEGHDFEYAVAELLRYNGWRDVEVTQGSGDYGIDILARRMNVKYAIQCKRYNKPVSNKAVQEAAAGTDYYHCDAAAVITNSSFTKPAVTLANTIGVKLWGREFLIKLIQNYDDGYDELYGQNHKNVSLSNTSTSKICPICKREFFISSVKCPICKCDLVNIASHKEKPVNLQREDSIPSGIELSSHITQKSTSATVKTVKKQKNKSSSHKQSSLGIIALVLSLTGYLSIFGLVLSIIDLRKKNNTKKTCSIIALVIACLLPFVALNMAYENLTSNNKTSSIASNNPSDDSFHEANEMQQDTVNNEESNSISELKFGDESIIDATINAMEQYDYIKDIAIIVDDDNNQIIIGVQVPSSISRDTAKMAGEDVARYLAFMAGTANNDYKLPGKDDIGGIYDNYDLLISVDDGYESFKIHGAKVTMAQKITWNGKIFQ